MAGQEPERGAALVEAGVLERGQLGYIGRNPADKAHILVATGDSGHGTTHGTIAGVLLTDLILGRPNPWGTLYDPSRKSVKSAAAVCTHLRCIVHWNSLEGTWDCPCHGSRLGTDGRVLNGPAAVGLQPRELEGD